MHNKHVALIELCEEPELVYPPSHNITITIVVVKVKQAEFNSSYSHGYDMT